MEISWEVDEEKHFLVGIIRNNSIIATYKT
jgi:hypothetical protein